MEVTTNMANEGAAAHFGDTISCVTITAFSQKIKMEYHFSAPAELLGFLDDTVGFLAVEERCLNHFKFENTICLSNINTISYNKFCITTNI